MRHPAQFKFRIEFQCVYHYKAGAANGTTTYPNQKGALRLDLLAGEQRTACEDCCSAMKKALTTRKAVGPDVENTYDSPTENRHNKIRSGMQRCPISCSFRTTQSQCEAEHTITTTCLKNNLSNQNSEQARTAEEPWPKENFQKQSIDYRNI